MLIHLLCNIAFAIPQQLSQQGRLMDSAGAAVSGSHDLTFRIYENLQFGFPLWSETISTPFNNGYYSVVLGADAATNPLEDSVLNHSSLYLEIQIDSNAPLHPRQEIHSAPYARMASTAAALEGGSVNATQISVAGNLVVDANGSWVGPTIALGWADLLNVPADLADGDDDMLAGISCQTGQILGWNGNGWDCTDDNGLTESEVESYIVNDPIDLAPGSSIGGVDILTANDVGTTLADLSCQDGELAKFDTILGWQCGMDNDTTDWNALANVPADFADGIDNDTSDWNALANVPADFADGIDNDTQLNDAQVDAFVSNGAIDLASGSSVGGKTLVANPGCADGEFLSWNASASEWDCTNLGNLLDADNDGIPSWEDCDDANPASTSKVDDQDCDGIVTANDCDDADPTSTAILEDGDCDGALTADDCDDSDPLSTWLVTDGDCDGILTADDCDDTDSLSTTVAIDADCDGIETGDDCDDNDASIGADGLAPSCAATSCLEVLNNGLASDGNYWLNPDNGTPYETYCDMSTDGGGWTLVATISDSGNDVWSQLMPEQDTGIWQSTTTLNSLSFTSDYKSEAYLDVPSTGILIKEGMANVLTANGCWSQQTFQSFIAGLSWNADGSDSNWSDSTGAHLCSFEHFGLNDSVFRASSHSGNERVIGFKWGERNGVQDGNKDRTMITSFHANGNTHHVDSPTGLGGFTAYGSNENYEDANECQGDGPDNCSNSSQSYQLFVR